MGKLIDLTGKKFGRWTVVNRASEANCNPVKWNCVCNCGNFGIISSQRLRLGKSLSCGCYRKERLSELYCKDETGNTYGHLTVLKRCGIDKTGSAMWLVRCNCGKESIISGKRLRNRKPSSCKECSDKLYWEKYQEDLSGNKYGMLTVLSKYENSDRRKSWNCICDCGNAAIIREDYLKCGAVSCGCIHSRAEATCKLLLSKYNIEFISQKTFLGCKHKGLLFFDIYIQNLNICIELDGKQHEESVEFFGGEEEFKQQKIRDKIKSKYCKENNIRLLRIPHTKFDNIEEVLRKNNIIC